MPLSNRKKAQLKALSRGGDIEAEAALLGLPDVALSKDTEGTVAANTIQVTGRVGDGATEIVFEVIDTGANATATVAVGTATAKVGNGTTKVWLRPIAGAFKVNVLEAGTEDVLVIVTSNTGDSQMIVLTFA